MADFLTELRAQPLLADGAMGSYLFERTGRLSEANHVYEAFNCDQPELIRGVHLEYLAAGARCLKTNTFGANRRQLRALGQEERLRAINLAGVRLAREAMAAHVERHPGAAQGFVLGSIGPAAGLTARAEEVAACYGDQLAAMVEAGVDALLLETFATLDLVEMVIGCIRGLPSTPPVIAELAWTADTTEGGPTPAQFIERMAMRGVAVAGVNCCAPWDAAAFVEVVREHPVVKSGKLLLSVMPNAGGFQRVGSRLLTTVNPEAAGKVARNLADAGVRLLGGCCEMHPPHIAEMRNYLHARGGARTVVTAVATDGAHTPAGPTEKRGNGRFSRKLMDREFAVSVELLPPRGTDDHIVQRKVDLVAELAAGGLVDAVDLTDGSRGIPLVPPGDFIQTVRERLGWTAAKGDALEFIPHFTGRDLNVMGIQGRLIGYHTNRIRSVLFITGDPPKMSPTYPRSTAVFDLDALGMVRFTHSCLNAGVDFGGVPLGKQADPRTRFTIGGGVELGARELAREQERLRRKIDAGLDFVMTQPAFDAAALAMLEPCRDRVRCVIGVMLLGSAEHAQRMARVPGVSVPAVILERFAALPQSEDQAKLGRELAAAQIRRLVREGWAGVYLMAVTNSAAATAVLREGLGG